MQWSVMPVSSAIISPAGPDSGKLFEEEDHMKGLRRLSLIAASFILACACISCESGSSGGSYDPAGHWQPIGEVVGSWAGYFYRGENGLIDINDGFSVDILEPDDDDIFVTAIITREKEARFIGDETQYVCLENSFGVNTSLDVRAIFAGFFDQYTYTSDTSGIGPYAADVVRINVGGQAIFTTDHLYGYYYEDVDDADMYYWEVLNYAATPASSDIKKIAGKWRIDDSFYTGNTLVLTITTTGVDEDPGRGIIQGSDDRGNLFEGEIIEIRYDDLPDVDLYDVFLTLTPHDSIDGVPFFDLEGLATFISTYHTEGLDLDSSLAIGVSDGSRMVTGMAAPVIPEE